MSCEHVGLEMKLSAVRTNERRLVQTVGTQHENRRLWQLRNRPMMAQNFNYLTTFNSVVAYGNDRYLLAQSTKFGICIA